MKPNHAPSESRKMELELESELESEYSYRLPPPPTPKYKALHCSEPGGSINLIAQHHKVPVTGPPQESTQKTTSMHSKTRYQPRSGVPETRLPQESTQKKTKRRGRM